VGRYPSALFGLSSTSPARSNLCHDIRRRAFVTSVTGSNSVRLAPFRSCFSIEALGVMRPVHFRRALDSGDTGRIPIARSGAFLIRSRGKGGAFLLASGTFRWPDPLGLFVLRLNRRVDGAAPVGPRLVRPRRAPRSRNAEDGRLRRYCSGCSRETEHTIRASGATSCQTCGQRRAAAVRPRLATWSRWPRNPDEPHGSRRP